MPAQILAALPIRRPVERRSVVMAAAGAMFGAVFALRQLSADATDPIAVLYLVPICLLSLEVGLKAAVAVSGLGLLLVGVWLLTTSTDLSALAFISYAAAYVAVGGMAGRFADRMRDGQRRQRALLESGLALARLEPDGDLAAALVAQTRSISPSAHARAELTDGSVAQAGVGWAGDAEEIVPIAIHGVRYGKLVVRRRDAIARDDRAALAILALQAAVAAENQRLLASERERAIIRAELHDAQLDLAERRGQLHELMSRQEAERDHVAHELHDDAAQMLAAVLLRLAALERERSSPEAGTRWRALREDVDATLQSLRSLAVSLRPPVLRLGLPAALGELADVARDHGFKVVEVAVDGAGSLGLETETMIYRVVEEALAAAGTARRVSIFTDGPEQLVVDVEGASQAITDDRLAILKARLELVGGALTASTPTGLRATIPLDPVAAAA